jgi:hypothetical protein
MRDSMPTSIDATESLSLLIGLANPCSGGPVKNFSFMEFPKRVITYESGDIEEVVRMVLKFECPECGKGDNSELIDVLPNRKYRMKCGDCECTLILTASEETNKKEKPDGGCCCCA